MQLRELFKRKKVEPAWVYRTRGVVWRLMPTDSGVFLGEDRDLDEKRVTFFCVDRITGEVRWEKISVAEPWWIGIEAVYRDRVFLHGFSQPDMPDHKGIIALDLTTGRRTWSSDDLRFLVANEASVFASRDTFSGSMICELDLRTGSLLRSWENETGDLILARSHMQTMSGSGVKFPVVLDETSASREPTLQSAYRHWQKEAIVGSVEVLDHHDFLFFSYHEKTNMDGQLHHLLKGVDKKRGTLVLDEILDHNLRAVVSDSFFLQDPMVYFVKDRSLLTAVNIHERKR